MVEEEETELLDGEGEDVREGRRPKGCGERVGERVGERAGERAGERRAEQSTERVALARRLRHLLPPPRSYSPAIIGRR